MKRLKWGSEKTAGSAGKERLWLSVICLGYLVAVVPFGTMRLDPDEFHVIREPYEILGGDYTVGYLGQGDIASAASVAVRSYYFYWKYRPLFSPIVSEDDKALFRKEEIAFGYVKPEQVMPGDTAAAAKYAARLVVPEPDRLYSHGAGKPLLPPLLSIPQLAAVRFALPSAKDLLTIQYTENYHPIFLLVRLVQILAGLASILILFRVLVGLYPAENSLLGCAVLALFPVSVKFFPNLHYDAILVPFALLSAASFSSGRYRLSGISLGLAMACKNTAILLPAAYLGGILWDWWRSAKASPGPETRGAWKSRAVGLATILLWAFLVLLPFANPFSYVSEILTPITGRAFDPRGEDLTQFTLGGLLSSGEGAGEFAPIRPEVHAVNLFTRISGMGFFFVVLAVFLLLPRPLKPFPRLSFLMLLLVLPHGLIFGDYMNWRALLFIPFFVALCVESAPRRALLLLFGLVLVVDVISWIDPMTADTLHYLTKRETFLSALARWLTS